MGLLKDPIETAAVSLASTVVLSFYAVNNLFGVGSSSMMSRCLGKKDIESAKRTASFGFWMTVLCSAGISIGYTVFSKQVLTILGADDTTWNATKDYLFWTVSLGAVPAILNVVMANMIRAEGEATHASVGVTAGCLLNIILDPFFVLPRFLGMGAAGAGLATFISNCVACLYLFAVVLFKRRTTIVCLSLRKFSFRRDIVKEVFTVGVPAAVQNLLNVASYTVLNNITASFGASAISAMGIAHKISMLPNYMSMGISQGVMPLIGYNYTAGNNKRVKDSIALVLKIALIISVSLVVAIMAGSGLIIRMFINNDEVVEIGKVLLREMILLAPFLTVDFLAVGVFQAIGKGQYCLIFAICRKLILEIPATILLNKFFSLYGMGFAQPIAELVMCIIAGIMLKKIMDGKLKKS